MITLAPGQSFGSYELVRLLGQGGFAQVWEGRHTGTGRRVALKVLTEVRAESTQALERFHQEGRLAASISHPRCVYVFSAEEIEGLPVISMELMSGGTLEERMKAGPMSSTQAVDYVLDVIDGLDEANRLGVVHRDVKPSNCFIDADGRARIGDFGISKSLEADSALTQTGAFLGTPYYSSPEQIGGETLDCRADLFSVGAMLYEMLSGRRPFDGANAGMVLTAVLTKPPAPLRLGGGVIPVGLEAIVFRLVEKQRDKRYQDYAALRAALLPHSSRAVRTGTLARRFAALVIDMLLFTPVSLFTSASAMSKGLASFAGASWTLIVLMFGYFWLMEGLLGWSVGKRLLGLRVVSVDGGMPGLSRSAKRAGLFTLIYNLASILTQVAVVIAGPQIVMNSSLQLVAGVGGFGVMFLLLVTMRKRNGFATVHDLVSGTRVITAEQQVAASAIHQESAVPVENVTTESGEQFGPYRTLATLWRRGGEALMTARDEDLKRDVWIHSYDSAALAPPMDRLHARRAGNLPWLQRGESGALGWDAYGAPQGRAFTQRVSESRGVSWKQMRSVLAAVGDELHARFEAFGTAGPLSLAHVWIGRDGEPVLLDFPAPGPGAVEAGTPAQVTPANWRVFVGELARTGLEGTRGAATGGGGAGVAPRVPAVPLPGYARAIVSRLCTDANPYPSVEEMVGALRTVQKGADQVTVLRRSMSLLIPAFPAIGLVFSMVTIKIMLANAPVWYTELSANLTDYVRVLDRVSADTLKPPRDSTGKQSERAIRIVLSAAYNSATKDALFGASLMSGLTARRRAEVEKSAKLYPSPTAADVSESLRWLRADPKGPRLLGAGAMGPVLLMAAFLSLGVLGVVAVVLAPIIRGGPVLALLGLRLLRLDGEPAERWRCLVRALVVWSPAIIFLAVKLRGLRLGSVKVDGLSLGAAGTALALITVAGGVWSVVRPSRGPGDLVVGTVVMPR